MGTWFTKHYALGLLAGIGIGLFIAGMLARSGDAGTLGLLVPVGFVAAVVGGVLYALAQRKAPVRPSGDRAEPGVAAETGRDIGS